MDIKKNLGDIVKALPDILLDPHKERSYISKKFAWAISIICAVPLGIPHIISAAVRSRSKVPIHNETHAKIGEIWNEHFAKPKPPLEGLAKTMVSFAKTQAKSNSYDVNNKEHIARLMGEIITKLETDSDPKVTFVDLLKDNLAKKILMKNPHIKKVIGMHEAMMAIVPKIHEKLKDDQILQLPDEACLSDCNDLLQPPLSLLYFVHNPYARAELFKNERAFEVVCHYTNITNNPESKILGKQCQQYWIKEQIEQQNAAAQVQTAAAQVQSPEKLAQPQEAAAVENSSGTNFPKTIEKKPKGVPAPAEPPKKEEDFSDLPPLVNIPEVQVSNGPMEIIYEIMDLAKMHRIKSNDSQNIANLMGKLIRKVEQTGLNFVEFLEDNSVKEIMSEDDLLKQVVDMHEAMMLAAEELSKSQVTSATPQDLKSIRAKLNEKNPPLSLRHFSCNHYATAILFKNDASRSIIEEYVKLQKNLGADSLVKTQLDALEMQLKKYMEKGEGVSGHTLLITLANQVVDLVSQFPDKSMEQDNIAELMGKISKNLEKYGVSLSELLADKEAIQVFTGNKEMGEVIELHRAMMNAAEKLIEMVTDSDRPVKENAENIQKFLREQTPRLTLRLFSQNPDALDKMFKSVQLRSAILFYIESYKKLSPEKIPEGTKIQLGVFRAELMEHAARSICTYFKDDVLVDALKNKEQNDLANILIAIRQRIEPLPVKDFLTDPSANKILSTHPLLYRVVRLLSTMDMEEPENVLDKGGEAARLAQNLAKQHAKEQGLVSQFGLRDKELFPDINVENLQNDAEFRKLYKQLAVKYHPDKGGDPEKFKQLKNLQELVREGKFQTYLKSLERLRKKPE